MTEEELKPCPFCGNTNLYYYYYDSDDRGNPLDPCVRCDKCEIIFKFRHGAGCDLDDIMKTWNRRVKE